MKIIYCIRVVFYLIGFFIYFIDNENYKSEGIKNIFDILKL